jgi:hypothetical protein
MFIVVSRSSVMPASSRPDIDDPMMASLLDATVAGPYMYFTVTSPMLTNTCIRYMKISTMIRGGGLPSPLAITTPVPPSLQIPGE